MSFDDAGWWVGTGAPWPVEECYSILAREDDSRMVAARWTHQAKRFFAAELRLAPDKIYEAGWPRHDRATMVIGPRQGEAVAVDLQTLPVDPAIRAAAMRGADAIGGAGLDQLVARSPRLWQVRADQGVASLAAAAVLASLVLGPILPPEADVVFGVKGARERLAARGWKT